MKELSIKKKKPRQIEGTIGGNKSGSTHALMSPIDRGRTVNLGPGDNIVAEMKSRKITHVRFTWEFNDDDQVETAVRQAGQAR